MGWTIRKELGNDIVYQNIEKHLTKQSKRSQVVGKYATDLSQGGVVVKSVSLVVQSIVISRTLQFSLWWTYRVPTRRRASKSVSDPWMVPD